MNKTLTKREVLEKSVNASAVVASGKWVAPSILGLSLPLHAQATTPPPAPGEPTTTPSPIEGENRPVCADVLTTSDSDSGPVSFNTMLNLSQYDPIDGSIASAVLDYQVSVTGTLGIENDEETPANGTVINTVDLAFQLPDGTFFVQQAIGSMDVDLEAHDGVIDFDGPSGQRLEVTYDQVLTGSIDLIDHGIDPSVLTGNGTVGFPVSASGDISATGSINNATYQIRTNASANASITYTCALLR